MVKDGDDWHGLQAARLDSDLKNVDYTNGGVLSSFRQLIVFFLFCSFQNSLRFGLAIFISTVRFPLFLLNTVYVYCVGGERKNLTKLKTSFHRHDVMSRHCDLENSNAGNINNQPMLFSNHFIWRFIHKIYSQKYIHCHFCTHYNPQILLVVSIC